MGLIKSRPQWEASAAAGAWSPSSGILSKCPGITEYLSKSLYEDGKPRQTSTLTVFIEGGMVKVALNDRDVERSSYMSGEGLEDALRSLEKHLVEEKVDWRAWGGKRKK